MDAERDEHVSAATRRAQTGPTQHYNLIASAIAARNVTVHWHASDRYGCYTDAQSIFLAQSEAGRDLTHHVIAQALLIRAGSFERRFVRQIAGKKRIASRYLFAEVVRNTRRNAQLLPFRFSQRPELCNFPFELVDREDSLRLATSGGSFPRIPDFVGSLRAIPLLRSTRHPATSAPLSQRQRQNEISAKQVSEMTEADAEGAEVSKVLRLLDNPVAKGGVLSSLIRQIMGAGASGKLDDEPGPGEELPIGSVTQGRKKGFFARLTNLALDFALPEAVDAGSRRYPEWDFSTKRYRANWARVDDLDPWSEDPMEDAVLDRILTPPSPDLRRKLAGIGLNLELHRSELNGDDFSLDALIHHAVDQRLGVTPSERVYTEMRRTRRDLGVLVLLDVSGSTAEKDASGCPVLHEQMRVAYRMACSLHELGDQVGLYGFHSWGRHQVRLLRIKSFGERRIDSRVRRRLSQIEPAGYTRTGAALRHAAHKLKHETGLPHRLLLVITDGFSYDQDYEGRYGEADTKKALEEIRAAGTGCLCLVVGSSLERAKLESIYGAAATLAVADHDEFLAGIRPALFGALQPLRDR